MPSRERRRITAASPPPMTVDAAALAPGNGNTSMSIPILPSTSRSRPATKSPSNTMAAAGDGADTACTESSKLVRSAPSVPPAVVAGANNSPIVVNAFFTLGSVHGRRCAESSAYRRGPAVVM